MILHADSQLDDIALECYNLRNKICSSWALCLLRETPVWYYHAKGLEDMNWDPDAWQPLMDYSQFLPWLVLVLSDKELRALATSELVRRTNWRYSGK